MTGIGKYTGEMAAWLAARGHQVRVVTAPPYYPAWRVSDEYKGRGYVVEGDALQHAAGEPLVFRCPLYVPEKATGLRRILHLLSFALSSTVPMLREAFNSPDIVWTVEPAFFCAPVALATASLANAPSWLHIQDFEIDAAFELGLLPARGVIHWFAQIMERGFTSAFSRVSSISIRMVERSFLKGVPPRRAVLFPNWVDIEQVQPAPRGSTNSFREELGLIGKVIFLYSGNMGNKQGLEVLAPLAKAFATERHVHFLFCGDGTYRPLLEGGVSNLPNVMLLPLQPAERLNDLLNAADIHLLPQRADAADLVMPSKLTGMLASGRPVLTTAERGTQVASVVGGDDTMGTPPCGIVVSPGDLAQLTDAAHALAANYALRRELGMAARAYAIRFLGKDQVLLRFEADLQAAIDEHRGIIDTGTPVDVESD